MSIVHFKGGLGSYSYPLADDLDDGALSDGGEDDLTPAQEGSVSLRHQWNRTYPLFTYTVQMAEGLSRVRHVLGSSTESGISDKEIRDALWQEYFNVETALQYLVGKLLSLKKGFSPQLCQSEG